MKLCDMKRDDNNFQAFIDRMEMAVLADSEQVLLAGAKDDEPEEPAMNTPCTNINCKPGCGKGSNTKCKKQKPRYTNDVPGCDCLESNVICLRQKK